jgi:hypothetical protein
MKSPSFSTGATPLGRNGWGVLSLSACPLAINPPEWQQRNMPGSQERVHLEKEIEKGEGVAEG